MLSQQCLIVIGWERSNFVIRSKQASSLTIYFLDRAHHLLNVFFCSSLLRGWLETWVFNSNLNSNSQFQLPKTQFQSILANSNSNSRSDFGNNPIQMKNSSHLRKFHILYLFQNRLCRIDQKILVQKRLSDRPKVFNSGPSQSKRPKNFISEPS